MTMEPIINPLLIYAANTLPRIGMACAVLGSLAVCAAAVAVVTIEEWRMSEQEVQAHKRLCRRAAILALILFAVSVLIPGKDTCYQLLTAHYLTVDNIDAVGGQVQELVDYIFDKIEEVS